MYIHIFLFRWKPDATADDCSRATHAIEGFRGEIPGLLEVAVGPNVAVNHGGHGFGGYMKFANAAACAAYADHPLHVALLEWLLPLIEAVELDLNPSKFEGTP
ncbi:Dabb family protein [Novosphingobium sp.]|uniref:Dabb family protein n=1 Tax=Novosphingobium sp. TaxID=1874826 RepID=UPI0025E49FF2|nr:Dabb family protein [Novosphingobium sp.]